MEFWTENYLFCIGLSILLTGILIPKILLIAFKKKLFDEQDERKIHKGVVPRLGGIAFLPSLLFAICLVLGADLKVNAAVTVPFIREVAVAMAFSVCALTLIYLVGLADDLVGVRYRAKFIVQILAGILVIVSGMWVGNLHGFLWIQEIPSWLGWIFTVFGIIYVVNSVNLIDGIDGLASGLSAVALIWYSYILWVAGEYVYMLLAGATLGTLIPFFYFNVFGDATKQKKIFMGDTGSLTIGMILAFLSIKVFNIPEIGQSVGLDYNVFVVAISPLMLPCFDVVRVFMHRVKNGRNPFLPDRSHIHHKLLAIGFKQSRALITIVCLDMLMVICNVLLSIVLQPTFVIIADVVILLGGNIVLTGLIRKREKRLNKTLYE